MVGLSSECNALCNIVASRSSIALTLHYVALHKHFIINSTRVCIVGLSSECNALCNVVASRSSIALALHYVALHKHSIINSTRVCIVGLSSECNALCNVVASRSSSIHLHFRVLHCFFNKVNSTSTPHKLTIQN